jgi:uncharacterized FlaG/YvyC family protein
MPLGAPTSSSSHPTEVPSARSAAVIATLSPARAAQTSQRSKPELSGPVSDTSRSRLAYDKELNRTFIEVVDVNSGEVVERFPPEEIVRHVEALLKQAEASRAAKRAGLVVDRVV